MRRIIFIFSFYDIFKLLCPFKPFFSPCRAKSLMYIYKLILHASLTLSLSYTHTHTHLKTISKGCPSFCKIFSTQLFCLFFLLFFFFFLLATLQYYTRRSQSEGSLGQSLTRQGLALMLHVAQHLASPQAEVLSIGAQLHNQFLFNLVKYLLQGTLYQYQISRLSIVTQTYSLDRTLTLCT